jgi:hypothetical protein
MRLVFAAVTVLALAASSLLQAVPLENKWRLQFSGNARSDGTLVLAITPSHGEAVTVPIQVAAGTRENRVAKRVVDVLREAIGADYKVERDDGEDVLVKRRLGRDRFNVTVVSNSIRGVRLNLDQE